MSREQFLAELRRSLGGIPEAEKKEILYDYEEHFRMGAADGQSEEEIGRKLGNPRVIGRSYRIDSLLEEPPEGGEVAAGSILRAAFASLSLTFFNAIFVLGPFFGLVGALVGLWAGAAAVGLSGVAGLLSLVVWPFFPGYVRLQGVEIAAVGFAAVGLIALGVLAVIGMGQLTRLFLRGLAAYVKLNLRIVSRRI
jgi:uncharacterized membrane protein